MRLSFSLSLSLSLSLFLHFSSPRCISLSQFLLSLAQIPIISPFIFLIIFTAFLLSQSLCLSFTFNYFLSFQFSVCILVLVLILILILIFTPLFPFSAFSHRVTFPHRVNAVGTKGQHPNFSENTPPTNFLKLQNKIFTLSGKQI